MLLPGANTSLSLGTPALHALVHDGPAAGASLLKWFQFGGNTYIVVDNDTLDAVTGTANDTPTFQDGIDSVICLTGLIDLSASTIAAGTDVIAYVAVA